MIKYNSTTINDIIFKKSHIKPDNNFLNIINKLKEEIKTIKFEYNNDNKNNDNKNNETKNYNFNNGNTLKSFENLRNYKSKIINEKSLFTNIRNLLNKITEKTYEKLLVDLINNIQLIYDNNDEQKDEITLFIFKFFTKNQFISTIYANIYNILCNKYNDFNNILISNLSYFDDILYNILNNNEPDNDIIINEYKSYFMFYSNCFNLDLIEGKTIIKILLSFQLKMIILIEKESKKKECEIINELVGLFVKNSKNTFQSKYKIIFNGECECYCLENENNNILFKNIYKISNFKLYDFKSLTNKIIFKNKDIVELFND